MDNTIILLIVLVVVILIIIMCTRMGGSGNTQSTPQPSQPNQPQNQSIIVLYTRDRCSHCDNLKKSGEWEKLQSQVGVDRAIRLYPKDITNPSMHPTITGHPTIMVFKNGVISPTGGVEYTGDRTAAGFLQALNA